MSERFADKYRFDGFVWLARDNWVARDKIPASLLQPHDQALAALDQNPDDKSAAVRWLDACDAIFARVNPILDGPAFRASLQADTLRKLGHEAQMARIHRQR